MRLLLSYCIGKYKTLLDTNKIFVDTFLEFNILVGHKLENLLIALAVTPEEFASNISVGKSSIYKILRGDTKKLTVSMAKKISEAYPQYSVDFLLEMNKSVQNSDVGENYFEPKAKSIPVTQPLEIFETKNGSQYEELGNGKYILTVPLVPVRAQARYIYEFTDAEYIEGLSKVSFIVDRVGVGVYRGFEIQNDSMNDGSIDSIPSGSYVCGRELSKTHWKDRLRINHFNDWIIVHENTVLCKRIKEHNVEKGIITCHSLNDSPEYQDFDIHLDEVKQLFNIVAVHTMR